MINLAADPATCVRFDRHAFYVGQPGDRPVVPQRAGRIDRGGARRGRQREGRDQPSQATEDPVAQRIMVNAPRITVTAAYRNDRSQVLAILKSAGLPPPVVQDPADIRLGTLTAGPTVAASATNSTGLGFDACAAPGRPS